MIMVEAERLGSCRRRSTSSKPSISGIMQSVYDERKGAAFLASLPHHRQGSRSAVHSAGLHAPVEQSLSKIFLFVALSSTTRIGKSFRRLTSSIMGCAARPLCKLRRRVTWNALPFPASLSTQIFPPIIVQKRDAIAKPRPVPPCFLDVDPSACSNARNIFFLFSGGVPMPVSATVRWRQTVSSYSSADSTFTTTSPSSVNLMALPTRLVRIWRTRPGSPMTASGISGGISYSSSRFFL